MSIVLSIGVPNIFWIFQKYSSSFWQCYKTLRQSFGDLQQSSDDLRILKCIIRIYVITKSMRTLWLVSQLWFIVPVNPWKICVSSELLNKSNRPQVSMVYRLIKHLGCWWNTQRIRKSLACGSWFTNSSRVLPTSRVVYQPITHRNLWSIAYATCSVT